MKKLILTIFLIFTTPTMSAVQTKNAEVATLRYEVDFIFQKVLEKKRLAHRADIPFPPIFFESKTSLKQFQDAIEKQWGQRPSQITNAFAVENNEIYLMDDAAYYKKLNRCIDDSLAHELVHYVQAKYLGWDLSHDESLEWEAIEIQTAFREEFCSK